MKRLNTQRAYAILQDKSASYPLKAQVERALNRDPVDVLKDLEVYNSIFDTLSEDDRREQMQYEGKPK